MMCYAITAVLCAHLEVGGHDFQRVSEEINPLYGRPRLLHRRNELRTLKLEKHVRVPVLDRAHQPKHGAHQLFAHAVGALPLARAQVKGRDWRRGFTVQFMEAVGAGVV